MNLAQVRKTATLFQSAWFNRGLERSGRGTLPCPACDRHMKQVDTRNQVASELGGGIQLDVCESCTLIWFDPQEREQAFPPEGTPILDSSGAIHVDRDPPRPAVERAFLSDVGLKGWLSIIGLPVEMDEPPRRERAWVTWGLITLLIGIFAWQTTTEGLAIQWVGFVPADPWRAGALPILLAGMSHAGWGHVLGNLYFFRVYGDNVEEVLGRARFGLLLLLAHLGGVLSHTLFSPHSVVPLVGFSFAVSGVIVYYALRFPRVGIFVHFFFRFFRVQVWVVLALWFLVQFSLMARQLAGVTNVSATGHLGGALVGAILWLYWRES
jgi:membrane associated rhomboid family serine protease